MKREQAYTVAYFLAKWDWSFVKDAGFKTKAEFFREYGKELGYTKNSMKNFVDFFIPYFAGNELQGWNKKKERKYTSYIHTQCKDITYLEALKYTWEIIIK